MISYLFILLLLITMFYIVNILSIKYNNIRYNNIRYNNIRYNNIRYNNIRYNNIKYNNIKTLENFSEDIKYCCIYAYYEKDNLYKNNFLYFLKNGILKNVDYYIVINGKCTVNIPKKENIIIYRRENKGYDFGAFSFVIKKITKNYNYYFFLNTSVCGPYLKNNNKEWINYFLDLFNKDVKIVGTSINIFPYDSYGGYDLNKIYNKKNPFIHIQSMFFCIDNEYFNYLNKINFFNENELNNAKDLEYIIAYKEIGLSQYALINNWNINSILSKYKDIDYRLVKIDFNNTSKNGDPYYEKSYFGNDINKFEVIFYKNNRYKPLDN
jgi:hypothetical protein